MGPGSILILSFHLWLEHPMCWPSPWVVISMLWLWTDFRRFFTILFDLFTLYWTEFTKLNDSNAWPHPHEIFSCVLTNSKWFQIHSLMTMRSHQACGIALNLCQWKNMHNHPVSVTLRVIDKAACPIRIIHDPQSTCQVMLITAILQWDAPMALLPQLTNVKITKVRSLSTIQVNDSSPIFHFTY